MSVHRKAEARKNGRAQKVTDCLEGQTTLGSKIKNLRKGEV
jgi:hypothetical protein